MDQDGSGLELLCSGGQDSLVIPTERRSVGYSVTLCPLGYFHVHIHIYTDVIMLLNCGKPRHNQGNYMYESSIESFLPTCDAVCDAVCDVNCSTLLEIRAGSHGLVR